MSGYLALYSRLSLRDGDKKEQDASNSIENQRKLLYGYLASHPEFAEYEVLEFVDDGYSGTNFNRPDAGRMLEMAKTGQIKVIIVKDLSRFGRNYVEVGTYLETVFPFLHVRFISILDNFDSKYRTAVGDMVLGFKNIRCDYYSKWLSKRIKQTKRFRAEKGVILMPPFFGYQKDKNTGQLIIDEPAAEVVRWIFAQRLAGWELVEITKNLNSNGVFTPSVRRQQLQGIPEENIRKNVWYTSAVRELLSNRQYTGCCIFGKTKSINYIETKCAEEDWIVTENRHEAIVSAEIFDAVQQTFTKRDTKRKRPADAFEAVFVGKIICGHCGKAYRKRVDGTYFCKSREYLDGEERCPNVRLKEMDIRKRVLEELQRRFGALDNGFEEDMQPKKADMATTANNNSIRKRLDGEAIRLYEAFAGGSMTKEAYLRERKALEAEKVCLDRQAAEQSQKLAAVQNRRGVYALLKQYAAVSPEQLTKSAVDELLERIVVYGAEQIEIVWKYEEIYLEMTGGSSI